MDKKVKDAGLRVLASAKRRLASIDHWCQLEFAMSSLNTRVPHTSKEAVKWSACGALWAATYDVLTPKQDFLPFYEENVEFSGYMEQKLGEICDQIVLQKFGIKFKSDSPYFAGIRLEEINDLHPVFMKRETCYNAVIDIFTKAEDLCR
jgi:hypothetical protein